MNTVFIMSGVVFVIIGIATLLYLSIWLRDLIIYLVAEKKRNAYSALDQVDLQHIRKLYIHNLLYGAACWLWLVPILVYIGQDKNPNNHWNLISLWYIIVGFVFFAIKKHRIIKRRKLILSHINDSKSYVYAPRVPIINQKGKRRLVWALCLLLVIGAVLSFRQADHIFKDHNRFSVMSSGTDGNMVVTELNLKQQQEFIGVFARDFAGDPGMDQFAESNRKMSKDAQSKINMYKTIGYLCLLLLGLSVLVLLGKRRSYSTADADSTPQIDAIDPPPL